MLEGCVYYVVICLTFDFLLWTLYVSNNKEPFFLEVIVAGYFHGISTTLTKSFSDFNETFSVDKAFNSKHFDKKIFLKSFCFHGEKLKMLLGENPKNGLFYTLEKKFLLIFSAKTRSKLNSKMIF